MATVAIPAVLGAHSTTGVAAQHASTATMRTVTSAGTTVPTAGAPGSVAFGSTSNEIVNPVGGGGPLTHAATRLNAHVGRAAADAALAASGSSVLRSFDGLNHFDQRSANGGNQFSLEPPDQGLCAGNGRVLEAVNDVLRVFDASGKPLSGVVDLNTFYGYPAAVNRTTGARGPFVTDPSCYFDTDTQRFFLNVLTIDVDPATGAFLGPNHLDLAVSNTANPVGAWTIYRLPAQDDGTQGTPDHGCSLNPDGTGHGPCFGDYPHIGADAHGFYITTNEYSFFGPEFHGAQVYAFSKRALARNARVVSFAQFDTHSAGPGGEPGFTVWPATSPADQYATAGRGTEYFLSSDAASETGNTTGASTNLITWALSGTDTVDSTFSLTLSNSVNTVAQYVMPPKSEQKNGPTPLRDCLNDSNTPTPFGPGCWRFFFTTGGPFNESLSNLDSNDTRMQQVTYQGGQLWGALDTGVLVGGKSRAGIEYFEVDPSVTATGVSSKLTRQGTFGMANANLIYPTIGLTGAGRGLMSFTLVGPKDYPSVAYADLSAATGVGAVHLVKAGVGPQDGFSGYGAFANPGTLERPRWGDYGATTVVGNDIFFATEYIGQRCTLTEYLEPSSFSPIGTCDNTRTALANWDTRISEVRP